MRIFFTTMLFFVTVLGAAEEKHSHCIYLCSRLTEIAKQWNNEISNGLLADFNLFRPQDINLKDLSADQIDWAAYLADARGLEQSDILLVLPPYGRDCAWEMGWFCGKGKPTIAYVEKESDWLRDAMVKGGLTAILTNQPSIYQALLTDPATSNKCYLIDSKKELGKTIKHICQLKHLLH